MAIFPVYEQNKVLLRSGYIFMAKRLLLISSLCETLGNDCYFAFTLRQAALCIHCNNILLKCILHIFYRPHGLLVEFIQFFGHSTSVVTEPTYAGEPSLKNYACSDI